MKLVSREIRIGRISYLNTLPFYSGLFEEGETPEVFEGSPAEINLAMREGRIDCAPMSSLEYAQAQGEYLLFPGLCIGSRDFSRSVLLLSKERIEGLNGETIILSGKSLSSQALLRILLEFKYGFTNRFQVSSGTINEMLQEGCAALAIGDEALFYEPKRFVYKYDLSDLWWSWTNLPFCFSLWAVRKSFYKTRAAETTEFYRRVKAAAERNIQDIEKLLSTGAGITLSDPRFSRAFGYLFNLVFSLDEKMTKGLKLFYDYAARAGLTPNVSALEFIETAGEADTQ